MTISRPSTASRGSAASEPLFVGYSGADVVCVTADEDLAGALRAALPTISVLAVATPEALADLLLSGSCRVLAMDLAELGGAAVTVIHHLAGQFPDVPIIGIGTRHEEPLVAGLISSGEIHRFLHRPISTGRARTFFDSALRRHAELRAPAAAPAPARRPPAPTIRPLAATYATARPPPSAPSARSENLVEPWYGSITLVVIGATVTVLAFGFMLLMHSSGPLSAPTSTPAATSAPVPAPAADLAATHPIVRGLLRPTQPRPAPAPRAAAPVPVARAAAAPLIATASVPAPGPATVPARPPAAVAATPAAPQAAPAATPAADASAATAAPVLVRTAAARAEFPAAARDAGVT
jgi:hypothetical protein